ncbi:hypothetical protein C7M61_000152 [Candidozyma pseudohaemuli]|uniref:Chromatin modification-related protein n=1 Tax=Candidozyma pseudohaemuli TaxID=418784 RepID=A0A2P7YX17_9ASCO|nr:hypothetical protein C7M61_000152 [[Candida] pseudohaemulonii]PSK40507.1 hypothetical protein C7M61_000152 [[Candida] pseudohaemulonii]
MHHDLPARQKSQRLVNKAKAEQGAGKYFNLFKQKPRNITNANELLPGLNDILDALEAMPMDLVKYMTLLKEIDAKCINSIPAINRQVASYIEDLHKDGAQDGLSREDKTQRLGRIRKRVFEVIPCLEEKMHVTSVAADVMAKHMYRINNDYKVIIGNNEIPELVRLGPLNHRAMVHDPAAAAEAAKSAQSQRLESRREALAARKANKDDDEDNGKRRRGNGRETTPLESVPVNGNGVGSKKRRAQDDKSLVPPEKKRAGNKPRRGDEEGLGPSGEPTYCYCDQVSFGEMVGCDGETCKREWFHLPCIGFKNPPKGKWYCDECLAKMKRKPQRA